MNKKRLPPGPRGLPLLGSAHLLAKNTHRVIDGIARRYGDICTVRVGQRPSIVISDPDLLLRAFSRPELSDRWLGRAFAFLSENKGLASLPPTRDWQALSDVFHREVASVGSVGDIMAHQVRPRITRMVERFRAAARDGHPVDPEPIIADTSWDVIFGITFGWQDNAGDTLPSLKDALRRETAWAVANAVKLGPGDLVPSLRFLPDPTLRQARRRRATRDETIRRIRQAVADRTGGSSPCILDILCRHRDAFSDTAIERTCFDLMIAGRPVEATTRWWLLVMANRPHVQHEVRRDLAEVKEANDEAEAGYARACFDESMRYRTTAPLGVPHMASTDTMLAGYHIPRGAQLLGNLHGIHHNPRFWDQPDLYRPERLLDDSGQRMEHNALMPFGAGLRECAVRELGYAAAWEMAQALVENFQFEAPGPGALPEDEVFGLTVDPTPHRLAVSEA